MMKLEQNGIIAHKIVSELTLHASPLCLIVEDNDNNYVGSCEETRAHEAIYALEVKRVS
jgi:hypothetical protein